MELQYLIGKSATPFTFQVDHRHIRQFARAIGDLNPLYFDAQYAKQTVHQGIIAPPTFPIAVIDETGEALDLGLDYNRMLHGEQQFLYSRPIRVNDVLTCKQVVTDVYERGGKNGTMAFVVLDTEMTDADGQHVVTSRTNIIYRPVAVK